MLIKSQSKKISSISTGPFKQHHSLWELLGLLTALELPWETTVVSGPAKQPPQQGLAWQGLPELDSVKFTYQQEINVVSTDKSILHETLKPAHPTLPMAVRLTPLCLTVQKAHYFILSPQVHTLWIPNLPTLCHSFHRAGQRAPAKAPFEPRHLAQPSPCHTGLTGRRRHLPRTPGPELLRGVPPRRAHPMHLGLWLCQAQGTQAELLLSRWNLKRCLRRDPSIQQQLTGTGSARPTWRWPNVKALQALTVQVQRPPHLCSSTDPPLSGCITLRTFKTKNAYSDTDDKDMTSWNCSLLLTPGTKIPHRFCGIYTQCLPSLPPALPHREPKHNNTYEHDPGYGEESKLLHQVKTLKVIQNINRPCSSCKELSYL